MEFVDERNEKIIFQGFYCYNTGRGIYNADNKEHLPNDISLEAEKQTFQIILSFCLAFSFSIVIVIISVNCDCYFIMHILSDFCKNIIIDYTVHSSFKSQILVP